MLEHPKALSTLTSIFGKVKILKILQWTISREYFIVENLAAYGSSRLPYF